jgi:adenosylhomocysteine nucleosidase
MSILVTFALETEFAPWRKLRGFKREPVDERDNAYRARVGDADVRVVLTGAGRFAARRAMAQAFSEIPEVCISSGLAGGLKPDYRIGEVLVARRVSEIKGVRSFQSHTRLLTLAAKMGARVAECFLVSENVIRSAEEKRALAASGDVVEMEGADVFSAAGLRHVPSVAIRAVSDTAGSDLPLDFDRVFNERGTVSISKVIGQLAANPRQIPGLLRLARESGRAATALACFLDSYVRRLAPNPKDEIAKADALAV